MEVRMMSRYYTDEFMEYQEHPYKHGKNNMITAENLPLKITYRKVKKSFDYCVKKISS